MQSIKTSPMRTSVRASATPDPRNAARGFFKDIKARRKEIEKKNLDSIANVQQSLKQIIKEELDFIKSIVQPVPETQEVEAVEVDEVIEDKWK
jgi:hypothetical protein